MIRCKWYNLKNPKYVEYHDNEWCKPNFDERYLLEMLILESFQAGLSWECVLNKREEFRKNSITSSACIGQIAGFGKNSYLAALLCLVKYLKNE